VVLHKKPGDPVRSGEPLFELRTDDTTDRPSVCLACQQ
jgi:pyruvate/2-oxoglutarate dehydrogenase complex dihydrolipoamide acyltransferase (E2) component